MPSVDNRVVDMQFNNKQFEQGINTSVNSLDKLKQALNFGNATNGLANLDKAAKSFSFGSISDTLTGISEKFSVLGIIGITTLQNLTNQAVNTGKRMVSALTIDPIKMGFNEYETKMGSIQTILTNTASKGTTLQQVTAALDDLNKYADKTIYNFAEMTRNIGTFTAAGVDLETSKIAIKGIANLAAASGSNAQQASTAMYQLSQALAAGSVKLMDWNSVVNAGMGGELFKNALKSTAEEMGTDVDAMIKKNGSFRESLQEGWITADVLNTTLKKLTKEGAQEYGEAMLKSGKYTQAQVDALMKQAAMAEDAATEVKTLTQMFDTMKESVQSGWAQTWEAIIGNKDESTKLLTSINTAFGNLIGPSTDARNAMFEFWNAAGGRTAVISGLSNIFKGLASILKPIAEAFREVFPAMDGAKLVRFSQDFQRLTEKFKIGESTIQAIKDTFVGLFSIINIGVQVISTIVKGIAMLFGAVIPAGNGILFLTSSIGNFFTSINKSIEASGIFAASLAGLQKILKPLPSMFDGVSKVSEIFSKLSEEVKKAIDYISVGLSNAFTNLNFDKLFSVINGGLIAGILAGIGKIFFSFSQVASSGQGFLKDARKIFDGVRGSLEAYQNTLKAEVLVKIAMAVGILSASLVALALVDPVRMTAGIAAISLLFAELIGSMALFEKAVTGPGFKSMVTITAMMVTLSLAILTLSASMLILSTMDWNGISKGLAGIGGLMLELALFMKLTQKAGMGIGSGSGLMLLAGALLTLSMAVKIMSTIDIESLKKGLGAIGILLAELLIFSKLFGNTKGLIGIGTGVTVLAVGLTVLAGAVAIFGNMSLETIGKGLGTLAGSLLILGLAMKGMSTGLPGAAAMLVIATAIAVLAPALLLLGTMSIESIASSILVLAGTLTVLGGMSVILGPLVPAMLGIAGAITLIGLGVGVAGAGVLALSAGLAALAVSGAAGAVALVAIATSLASVIPIYIKKFGEGIVELANVIGNSAPSFMKAVMKLVIALLDTLISNIPKIVSMGTELIVGLLNGIAYMLPRIIQAGFDLIVSFINGLADAIRRNNSRLVDAGINLMESIVEGCWATITALKDEYKKIGNNIVDGVINGIKEKFTEAATWAGKLGLRLVDSMKDVLGIESPSKMFKDEIGAMTNAGLAKGIKDTADEPVNETKKVGEKVAEAGKSILDSVKASIDERKYYNKISLEEELKDWEAVQKKYKAGSEERKQIDKEIYRVKNEMLKASFDNSVKWIDEQKYYDKMSLADELAAWERVQARYAQGTEERKRADREVYRLKKDLTAQQKQIDEDYYNATKAINDRLKSDIQSVNNEYESALASRTDALFRSYGLFDKVNPKEAVNGEDLITNLQDQVIEFETWQKSITELSEKGIEEGLLKELQSMGPSAIAQIQALNALSTPQLDMYVSLWRTKYNDAKIQATAELVGLKADTQIKIEELKVQAETELETYKNIWITKSAELRTNVTTEVSQMVTDTTTALSNLGTSAQTTVSTATTSIKTEFAKQDWKSIGTNIVQGIIKGVSDNSHLLINQMKELAKEALMAAYAELGIESPSKEFEKVGMFAVQGFVNGLSDITSINSAGTNIGSTAIDSLKKTISDISNAVNGNIDMTPTIRPVIDLTDVESGAKNISSLLGNTPSINSDTSIDRASSISASQLAQNRVTNSGMTTQLQPQSSNGQTLVMNVTMNVKSAAEAIRELDILNKQLAVNY